MGSNRLAKVTGVQAQLLANDYVHCLGVGFPQAWQSCWLYCLNNLQDSQVSPRASTAARHLQLRQQLLQAEQDFLTPCKGCKQPTQHQQSPT